MAPSKVVMLIANETNPTNLQNADKLRTLFQSKKIVWEEIDGTDPKNKEKRSELFGVSGLRAEYPQVFFQDPSSSQYLFIGNYGKVSSLNENAEMLRSHSEILEHNPDLADQVFDKVFAEVMPGFAATTDTQSPPVRRPLDEHFDFDALDELEAELKATEVKSIAEEAKLEAKAEVANEEAKTPKQQQVDSAIFAMSFEQQELSRQTTAEQSPVHQRESPTFGVRTAIVEEEKEDKGQTTAEQSPVHQRESPTFGVRTAIVEEEKEDKGQQLLECNEVVLLEKDVAEDTNNKTEKAEERPEESSVKAQRLRKRDRVKRWFRRLTCTQRT